MKFNPFAITFNTTDEKLEKLPELKYKMRI